MALAIFAIANSRHQRLGIRPIANRATQAAALNFLHDFLPMGGCIGVIIIPTDAIQTKPESAPAAWEEFYFPPALTVGGPADVGHRMMRLCRSRIVVIRPRSAAEPWGGSCTFVDPARTTRQIHRVARAPCQITSESPKPYGAQRRSSRGTNHTQVFSGRSRSAAWCGRAWPDCERRCAARWQGRKPGRIMGPAQSRQQRGKL